MWKTIVVKTCNFKNKVQDLNVELKMQGLWIFWMILMTKFMQML
jgi:hypothetical protein